MNPTRQEKRGVLAPKSSRFDLSHAHKTTLDFFRLQPIYCKDMVPGDKFSVNVRSFLEAAPLATKVYGSCHLDLHAFFVPTRLLWVDWNNYVLGNTRSNSNAYSIPALYANAIYYRFGEHRAEDNDSDRDARRIFSGIGYPMYCEEQPNSFTLSALPARAYQKIWWDYYRDSINIPEADKASYLDDWYREYTYQDIAILMRPRYRCFHKDYISTLLSSPQMSDASAATVDINTNPTTEGYLAEQYNTYNKQEVLEGGFSILRTVSAAALRATMATQRYLERLNVTGTRPLERVFSLLGVHPDKTRLQMAEFIGAKTIVVNVDGLTNTSSTNSLDSGASIGNAFGVQPDLDGVSIGMGYQQGYSKASGQSDNFNYTATEHGFFFIIASLIPDYVNVNSIDRMFYRGISTPNHDRFDFYTPDFEGLGYQEVLASEVYFPSHASVDENAKWKSTQVSGGEYDPYAVVGYAPKYEDYRYQGDKLSGDFMSLRSKNSMPQFVYKRDFAQFIDPGELVAGLNLTTATSADRASFDQHFVITSSEYDHFIMNNYIVVDAVRPMTGQEMPTELSELANSKLLDVSNGGMRI